MYGQNKPKAVMYIAGPRMDEAALNARKQLFWEHGYGVLTVASNPEAHYALGSVSVDAVVTDLQRKPPKELRVKYGGASIPAVYTTPLLEDKIDEFFARLDSEIRRARAQDYEPYRIVMDYAQWARPRVEEGSIAFAEVPQEVKEAIANLFRTRLFNLNIKDALLGGVHAGLETGGAINPKQNYPEASSLANCLKVLVLKPGQDLSEILRRIANDVSFFREQNRQGKGGKWAMPIAYASFRDAPLNAREETPIAKAVVMYTYHIGPTEERIEAVLADDLEGRISPPDRTRIVSRTMRAGLAATSKYQEYWSTAGKPGDNTPLIDYHKARLVKAVQGISEVLGDDSRKHAAARFACLFDYPGLRTISMTGLINDHSKSNTIVMTGKQDADLNDILQAYYEEDITSSLLQKVWVALRPSGSRGDVAGNPARKVKSTSRIGEMLRFVDVGYQVRYYADAFVRYALSPGNFCDAAAGTGLPDLWIGQARQYFSASYMPSIGIPQAISFGKRRDGHVHPDRFTEAFRAIALFRLTALAHDAVKKAESNEVAFAHGDITPDQYQSNRQLCVYNFRAYGRLLSLMALTFAEYAKAHEPHDNWLGRMGQNAGTFLVGFPEKKYWEEMRRHYQSARKLYESRELDAEALFPKEVSREYHLLGREIEQKAGSLEQHLAGFRGTIRHKIEYKPVNSP